MIGELYRVPRRGTWCRQRTPRLSWRPRARVQLQRQPTPIGEFHPPAGAWHVASDGAPQRFALGLHPAWVVRGLCGHTLMVQVEPPARSPDGYGPGVRYAIETAAARPSEGPVCRRCDRLALRS